MHTNTLNTNYCKNGFDMSTEDWLDYNVTQSQVNKWLKKDPSTFDTDDAYGKNITSTDSWLLTIFISLLQSFFIVGPIITFITRIIKELLF